MSGSIINMAMPIRRSFGGKGCIKGTTRRNNKLGRFKVRLFHRVSGFFMEEVWTPYSGDFDFKGVQPLDGAYTIILLDHVEPRYRPVVADYITPELVS